MSKSNDFLKLEKDYYGKIYVELTYAIDNISPFINSSELSNRKYAAKLPVLKKYIDLIESTEAELHKKNGFFRFFNDDKYIDLLKSYKDDNSEVFNQLENCSHCVHRNYMEDKFDGCLACRPDSRIVYYDNKINVTLHDNWNLNLTNDRTGENDKYKVLATLQDVEKNRKYIVIKNLRNSDKFILHYYPGISEDSYGEIDDAEEFDFVVSTYERIEE